MKKNNTNVKSLLTKAKPIFVFLLIQLLLVGFLISMINEKRQINLSETTTVSFVADRFYEKGASKTHFMYIDHGGQTYVYLCPFNSYIESDRNQKLVTEPLTIRYIVDYYKNNIIVDIRSNNTVFYTLESFNKEQQVNLIGMIVVFVVFEILFLFVSFIFSIDTFLKIRKRLLKKRRKRRRH